MLLSRECGSISSYFNYNWDDFFFWIGTENEDSMYAFMQHIECTTIVFLKTIHSLCTRWLEKSSSSNLWTLTENIHTVANFSSTREDPKVEQISKRHWHIKLAVVDFYLPSGIYWTLHTGPNIPPVYRRLGIQRITPGVGRENNSFQ